MEHTFVAHASACSGELQLAVRIVG